MFAVKYSKEKKTGYRRVQKPSQDLVSEHSSNPELRLAILKVTNVIKFQQSSFKSEPVTLDDLVACFKHLFRFHKIVPGFFSLTPTDVEIIKLTYSKGMSRLHDAIYERDMQALRLSLQQGLDDIEELDEGGITPLWLAVTRGEAAIAELLLRAGANDIFIDEYGLTTVDQVIDVADGGVDSAYPPAWERVRPHIAVMATFLRVRGHLDSCC